MSDETAGERPDDLDEPAQRRSARARAQAARGRCRRRAGAHDVPPCRGRPARETSLRQPARGGARLPGEQGAEWIHRRPRRRVRPRLQPRACFAEVVGAPDIDVEMSGGIRDDASLAAALATGLPPRQHRHRRAEDPEWVARIIGEHGDKIAVGLDVRGTTLSRAAGRRTAATSGRCSRASTARAARATSSPTSPRTAR